MKKVLEITVKLKKQRNELIFKRSSHPERRDSSPAARNDTCHPESLCHPERSEGSLSYEFHTKELPIENRVNDALLKILLKTFPEFQKARIIRGLRSKKKLVELLSA